jgi:ABC-type branched-subunit amino acid transport system substrate-binding protein
MPEFDRDSNMTKLFFEKYQERFGSAPEIDFHSTGTYDAVKLFVEAVDHVGYDGDDVKNYLINEVNDWHGLNGVISFDENGNTQTGLC